MNSAQGLTEKSELLCFCGAGRNNFAFLPFAFTNHDCSLCEVGWGREEDSGWLGASKNSVVIFSICNLNFPNAFFESVLALIY